MHVSGGLPEALSAAAAEVPDLRIEHPNHVHVIVPPRAGRRPA